MANTGPDNTTTGQTHTGHCCSGHRLSRAKIRVRIGQRLSKVSLSDILLKNPGLIPMLKIAWINTPELVSQVLMLPKKSPETLAESRKKNFWKINLFPEKANFHFQQK